MLVIHFASCQIVSCHISFIDRHMDDAFSVDFSMSKCWVFAIYLVNILSSRFVAENVTIYSKSN